MDRCLLRSFAKTKHKNTANYRIPNVPSSLEQVQVEKGCASESMGSRWRTVEHLHLVLRAYFTRVPTNFTCFMECVHYLRPHSYNIYKCMYSVSVYLYIRFTNDYSAAYLKLPLRFYCASKSSKLCQNCITFLAIAIVMDISNCIYNV